MQRINHKFSRLELILYVFYGTPAAMWLLVFFKGIFVMKSNKLNKMFTSSLNRQRLSALLLLSISQSVLGHPGLKYDPTISPEALYSIEHGCGSNPVIGSIIVLPAVGGSPIIKINGEKTDQLLEDLLVSAGSFMKLVIDKSVFNLQKPIRDELGNVIGFWTGGGTAVPTDAVAFLPFRPDVHAEFPEESCVNKVTYRVTAIDVCNVTTWADGVADKDYSLWVPAVGSDFDGNPNGHAYDFTRNLTVTRNLAENPLPGECGEGNEITVSPSAEQLNRDLRIKLDGQQIWPLP